MNHNIIGFGGRLASGKSELASICEQYGYTKLYFALPLKQLCADLLDVSIDELNRLKRNNQPIDITVNDDWVDIIHTETNIPYEVINSIINGKVIHTVRELLQAVGTDVIRQFNPNWHVERIREMIKPNNKYVIDDVRFPNEKNMIEEMNGVCWYVIRPIINNVSNHISETALDWRQFDNIIVTDRDKVIAVSGPLKKKYLGKEINEFTERSIERRDSFSEKQKKNFKIVKEEEENGYYTFASIVNNGDAIGSVIVISTDVPITDVEDKMTTVLSKLLSNSLPE